MPLTAVLSSCVLCGLGALLSPVNVVTWYVFAALCCLLGLAFVVVFVVSDRQLVRLYREKVASSCCGCGSKACEDKSFRKGEFVPISSQA